MIQAKGITKAYGSVSVLKGIDVSIQKSEVVSIVGKSGAGKSTLLHILGTLDKQDQGNIEINGQNINGLKDKKLAEFRNQNIGFVFQFHHLLNEFTALENVCIPGYIRKENTQKVESKAKELLDYLGLSHRIAHKPNQLSGGEAQRVAIARSLINDPLIIFADEPTGNLDSFNSNVLHQLFLDLRRDFGHTFVIVTHNEDLAKLSDTIITLDDGKVVSQ